MPFWQHVGGDSVTARDLGEDLPFAGGGRVGVFAQHRYMEKQSEEGGPTKAVKLFAVVFFGDLNLTCRNCLPAVFFSSAEHFQLSTWSKMFYGHRKPTRPPTPTLRKIKNRM